MMQHLYIYISQKQDEHNIYVYVYVFVIMKTMCPPGYHYNGFVATYTLGHIMYVIKCKIYIYIHIYIYIYNMKTVKIWKLHETINF